MRTLVVGDIHGGFKALIQVLDRCGYDKKKDRLIFLGDYVDGWPESFQVIEKLIELQQENYNNIFLMGNHDYWMYGFMLFGIHPVAWLHGGHTTLQSYADNNISGRTINILPKMGGYTSNLTNADIPLSHIDFFNSLDYKYHDKKSNIAYVHGGFFKDLNDEKNILMWDRDLWERIALPGNKSQNMPKVLTKYKEIYIGHTSTVNWDTDKPMMACNVINVDTGGGWHGKLTILDVDTKEYWQSDLVKDLYNGHKGRM